MGIPPESESESSETSSEGDSISSELKNDFVPPRKMSPESTIPEGRSSWVPTASTASATFGGQATGSHTSHAHGPMWKMALTALGVVYGDIGTSPLYAVRACFHGNEHIAPTPNNVLGILSLFFWSLLSVVTFKYLWFITRADNEGEGGILALLALVLPKGGTAKITSVILAGLFGAALLYADGMLTPAISVLSAVEGIEQISALAKFRHYVQDELGVPLVQVLAISIIVGLFIVQKRGTAKVGMVFGPVMTLWFTTLGIMGLYWIVQVPSVLLAVSPHYAFEFFLTNKLWGFLVLGSVVLCITGGEALYADMGHFGRKPIALAWYTLVWPGLILNYFGQGAFYLSHNGHVDAPFFEMVSPMLRVPLVILATMATVIASQALISGAFSITRQAIQLGYLPRLEIRHMSSEAEGQIYVPEINWMLMCACVSLVLIFGSSSRMEAAYGIAVTGTMIITTVLFYLLVRKSFATWKLFAICGTMIVIDLAFFFANVVKIRSGGWIPLAVAAVLLSMMTSWKLGRERVGQFLMSRSKPIEDFLNQLDRDVPVRVPGTAVFMTSSAAGTPPILLHHYKHNRVLHEQVVLLSISTQDQPRVPRAERVSVMRMRDGVFRVTARYGFMQVPRVTEILGECHKQGLHTRSQETSFFLGREKLVITNNPGLSHWRKIVFAFLSRNARPASDFFKIPPDRVVEIGMQLEL